MRTRSVWLVLSALLMAGGCASSGDPGPTTTSATPAPAARPDFPLRGGDVVRLRIWREPDLSGEFIIDEHGTVVLPKIGAVAAEGRTPAELEDTLREAYARYLRNPSIEIMLLRRINILGAVRSPGLYPVDPTLTLADALALAGGVLPNGRQDRVEIFRGDARLVTNVSGHTRVGDLGLRSGDQLYIPERSWASRNAGILATVGSTILSVAASLIIAFR